MKGELTILSALRVPPHARLVVQAAGGRFESISGVPDPAIRQQLLTAIGELVFFAGGYQALVEAGVAPGIIQEEPAPVEREADMDPRQSAFIASLEKQSESLSTSRPSAKEDKPTAMLEAEGEPEVLLNLAEEIDLILQRNLAQHASLSSRTIRLETDPDGLLLIEVDGLFYRSVDEIDDQQVKDVIAQARREWERQ